MISELRTNMFARLPKISVITPSFNQGKYIQQTIESVVSQDYPNLEYIIIDGGSTDQSISIIQAYDPQIAYWVSEPDNGQSHAINKGFERASGDIFCWLNSDDRFAPNALWHVATAFMTSRADMVAGICEVYENEKLIHRHLTSCSNGMLPLNHLLDLENGWNAGQFFYQPEVFFSRDLWMKAGGHVREDCFYSMDYELWCRFALNQAQLHVVGAPLVHFRQHAEQKTADPDKFKKELIEVKARFIEETNTELETKSLRPEGNWSNRLKVALVNNLGFLYGAGIAQQRLAGAFEMAGHLVNCFDLLSYGPGAEQHLINDVDAFSPDIIIFGNLHGNNHSPVSVISVLEKKYKSYWLTHDMWLITGRCAYFSECNLYKHGCSADCQTHSAYPSLEPNKIMDAWREKRQLLETSSNLTILANSQWSKDVFESVMPLNTSLTVENIRLGVPSNIYKPLDKAKCRRVFNIPDNEFVLFFSVSSISDERKGSQLLLTGLALLNIPNLTLLVVGRIDESITIENARLISLGYIKEASLIVEAMNAADLYIGPSLEETFGQVFMEAAMCGLPSVGFDVTGVKDAICQDVTGMKVKSVTSASLADAIFELYSNPNKLSEMSRLARCYALNEHSIERSYASIFSVLDKQGVIDELGIAHKISLAQSSQIIDFGNRGWRDFSLFEKGVFVSKKSVVKLIDYLPSGLRATIVRYLPKAIERFLIRILY